MELLSSDEYAGHARGILKTLGVTRRRRLTGEEELVFPSGLVYVLIHKTREKGRVVEVKIRCAAGTRRELEEALKRSTVSTHANTALIERLNGTVRQGNARKARKVYTFSKEYEQHVAMSWFAAAYYNFCRPHLGLRIGQGKRSHRRWTKRTPAMAAGLTDHIWGLAEFMCAPMLHQPLPRYPRR